MSAPPTPATPYEELLHRVLTQGKPKGDRTGTGTLSLFGAQMRFDLSGGTLPLVTTKKVHFKSVVLELLWFLSGSTNVRWLQERGCTIWDEWADAAGELGPVYGKQWRSWGAPDGRSIDQMMQAVELLKTDPDSRRNIICSWNVADVPAMALAPCHALAQLYVLDGKLSLHLYQRSCDTFLGLPFNIASYSLLTHMLAQQTDLAAGEFVWSGGDVHLYNNHIEQARQLLERTPLPWPRIRFARRPKDIFSWQLEDFVLENYQHHPHIAAPVAV